MMIRVAARSGAGGIVVVADKPFLCIAATRAACGRTYIREYLSVTDLADAHLALQLRHGTRLFGTRGARRRDAGGGTSDPGRGGGAPRRRPRCPGRRPQLHRNGVLLDV